MSNSPLATYKRISPNRTSPRNHEIDTVSIHCVVGQFTAKRIVEMSHFVNYDEDNGCSCNYAVGCDGSIAMGVEEKDRSWCTSSRSNDHRAITIEVASDTTHPYAVRDAAYKALIDLLVDICMRNPGIGTLKWCGDKNLIGQVDKQNMTVHRWFAAKACPGDYLYNRHGQIAKEVNARLGNVTVAKPEKKPSSEKVLYRVQTGAFKNKSKADVTLNKLKALGYQVYMVLDDGYYKVQVGAFENKTNAEKLASKLKADGFSTYISTKTGKPVSLTALKSIDEIAHEVIAGEWGNGADRKARLTKAGYSYDEVQDRVNELL